MRSYLKTESVQVGDYQVTIRELSVGRANELIAFQKDEANLPHAAAMACKLGVVEWADETVEDIEANVSYMQVIDLARRVNKISGLQNEGDDKPVPSEPAPSESSSTG